VFDYLLQILQAVLDLALVAPLDEGGRELADGAAGRFVVDLERHPASLAGGLDTYPEPQT
jgi:hypothetical protein